MVLGQFDSAPSSSSKKHTMKRPTEDDIRDIAIRITNKLIELGYVPDCTDTDDESEFEVQDSIVDIITESIK